MRTSNIPAGAVQENSCIKSVICCLGITARLDAMYAVVMKLARKRSRHQAEEEGGECAREGVKEEGRGKCPYKASNHGYDIEMPYHKLGKDRTIVNSITPSPRTGAAEKAEKAEKAKAPDLASSCSSCLRGLGTAVRSTPGISWLLKPRRNGSGKRTQDLESLPFDLRRTNLAENSKALSNSSRERIVSDASLRLRRESGEGSLTAMNFYINDEAWQCTAFNLESKRWTRLPSLSFLPTPDASLFKEYSVCGNGGIMCVNVSKTPHKEDLVVFNLLTRETRQLPSLNYPRNPVLIHILVDSATNAYKVVAAGCSSSSGEEHLSRRVEVFDSLTSQWKVANDIPGPEFALNEHQTGVCVEGILYFVAFLEADGLKGVVAFDVVKGEWLKNRNCSVPFSLHSNILQVVGSGGNVYLFSEQEREGAVEHCIDELDFSASNGEAERTELKNVIRVKKSGGRGLLVYPENICVPYGEGKLCIFNTIKRDGVVYNIQSGMQCEELEPPPKSQRGDNFFSLNPVSFTLQPNFISKP